VLVDQLVDLVEAPGLGELAPVARELAGIVAVVLDRPLVRALQPPPVGRDVDPRALPGRKRRVTATEKLLARNQEYARTFDPKPNGSPVKKVAILACMDARLDPAKALGLQEGDAHVIRNAGGVVTDDEIRSLAISQRLLGTEEIILIHHTDCGMLTFTDDGFRRTIQDETGIKPEWPAEAFDDLEEDVRQSIARIKARPFVPRKDSVRGFVYDVHTGRLDEVA
jgi:carbonic anhydrase